jgi:hypothetical protein
MDATLRAALRIPRIRDEFTPAQLAVEAERVLKRPEVADNYSMDQKHQLKNILLEFSGTVGNSEGAALERQVKFVARRLVGYHVEHSPVTLPEGNQWQAAWDTRFDNRPEYRQALRDSATDWGAMKRKKSKSRGKSRGKSKSKSKSRGKSRKLRR